MSPEDLKVALGSGLLSFPVTAFDAEGKFNEEPYRRHVEWLAGFEATVLFAAGGTGEVFSMTPAEQARVVAVAVETCGSDTPIIAGAGYGTRLAIEMTRAAAAAGAAGVLLMPHYLTEASQAGLAAHIEAVCKASSIGVIVYNRNVCKLEAETVARLAERNPNLVGFKDGVGDIEAVMSVRNLLGDRLSYLGGLPTAEVFAEAYNAAGFPVYSSAVFNFIPRTAMEFYQAVRSGDTATTQRLLKDFFFPYLAIRNRGQGYAVSIVKAGATIVGHSAGPVRPPITDLKPAEVADLRALIERLGPQ